MSDSTDHAGHGNSAHASAEHEVSIESDGEELTEEPLHIEREPGGGQAMASARDLAAEQRHGKR